MLLLILLLLLKKMNFWINCIPLLVCIVVIHLSLLLTMNFPDSSDLDIARALSLSLQDVEKHTDFENQVAMALSLSMDTPLQDRTCYMCRESSHSQLEYVYVPSIKMGKALLVCKQCRPIVLKIDDMENMHFGSAAAAAAASPPPVDVGLDLSAAIEAINTACANFGHIKDASAADAPVCASPSCFLCTRSSNLVRHNGEINGLGPHEYVCKECLDKWRLEVRNRERQKLEDHGAAAHGGAAAAPPLAVVVDESNLPAIVAAINAACDERDLAAAFGSAAFGGDAFGGAAAYGGGAAAAADDDFHNALAASLEESSRPTDEDDNTLLAEALSLSMLEEERKLRIAYARLAGRHQAGLLENGGILP